MKPPAQRRKELEALNAWLERLNAEHPFLFNLLAVGIGLLIVGLAALLNFILKGITK